MNRPIARRRRKNAPPTRPLLNELRVQVGNLLRVNADPPHQRRDAVHLQPLCQGSEAQIPPEPDAARGAGDGAQRRRGRPRSAGRPLLRFDGRGGTQRLGPFCDVGCRAALHFVGYGSLAAALRGGSGGEGESDPVSYPALVLSCAVGASAQAWLDTALLATVARNLPADRGAALGEFFLFWISRLRGGKGLEGSQCSGGKGFEGSQCSGGSEKEG